MKRLVIGIILLLLVIGVTYYRLVPPVHAPQKPPLTPPTTPNYLTVTPTQQFFCNPKDLQATMETDAGAGNIYGILTLKNTSTIPCHINGDNKITATSSAKNISLNYYPITLSKDIILSPNQSLFGKVHYPNGPQCQTGIVTSKITFSYQVSPNNIISFINTATQSEGNIVTCVGLENITQVDIWNLSTHEQ